MKNPVIPGSPAKSSHYGLKWVDSRPIGLTLINALLYWPWRWLRVAYDAGDRHPELGLFMMALTLWAWWQLLTAVVHRINGNCQR
jgi:hypothetical protein